MVLFDNLAGEHTCSHMSGFATCQLYLSQLQNVFPWVKKYICPNWQACRRTHVESHAPGLPFLKHKSHFCCTSSICTNYTSVFVPIAQIYLPSAPNHLYPVDTTHHCTLIAWLRETASCVDIRWSSKKRGEKALTTNSLLDLQTSCPLLHALPITPCLSEKSV